MVSQATVQAKVNTGFAKAAASLGVACQWYRPSGPTNPIVAGNLIGTLQVLFDTNPYMTQVAARRRDKPEEWFAAFDESQGVAIGDYLVTPTPETYFVATLDPFRPARMALCNRIISITNPAMQPTTGYNPIYGGDAIATETPVITGFPAVVIRGSRGEPGDVKLPGDTKLPWEEVLLPAIPGATLRNDMIVTYSDGTDSFRLILSLVELTSLGYRCTAILETG